MKEPKHTPPPWRPEGVWIRAQQAPHRQGICKMLFIPVDQYEPELNGVVNANARLIAAAPDMYDLLEEIAIGPYEDSDCRSLCEAHAARAQALLAKARGHEHPGQGIVPLRRRCQTCSARQRRPKAFCPVEPVVSRRVKDL